MPKFISSGLFASTNPTSTFAVAKKSINFVVGVTLWTVRLPMLMMTALLGLITHVIRMCADKQVGWIHTVRIITMVENVQPFRNWTVSQNPRIPMGSDCGIMGRRKRPVTVAMGAYPPPTSLRFNDLLPKAYFGRAMFHAEIPARRVP